MTPREYIASGLLEAYALGLLPPEEQREVEAMARQHPEVAEALKEQQAVTEHLARASAVEPPAGWKQDILAAATGQSEPANAAKRTPPGTRPVPETSASNFPRWLAVAATLVLLFSLGINLVQYRQVQELKEILLHTELRLASLEMEHQSITARYEELEQNLAVLRHPATAIFVMKGVENRDPHFRADVFWNAESEKVFLDVINLPEPPPGKEYQLWALRDGQPVDMGVFDATICRKEGLAEIGVVPGADAFAVTLEPAGGSAQPTLEEMYVYGEPLKI